MHTPGGTAIQRQQTDPNVMSPKTTLPFKHPPPQWARLPPPLEKAVNSQSYANSDEVESMTAYTTATSTTEGDDGAALLDGLSGLLSGPNDDAETDDESEFG